MKSWRRWLRRRMCWNMLVRRLYTRLCTKFLIVFIMFVIIKRFYNLCQCGRKGTRTWIKWWRRGWKIRLFWNIFGMRWCNRLCRKFLIPIIIGTIINGGSGGCRMFRFLTFLVSKYIVSPSELEVQSLDVITIFQVPLVTLVLLTFLKGIEQ